MRLSCPEQMLGDRPLADKIAIIRAAGFDGIDVRFDTANDADSRRTLAADGLPVASVYSQIRQPSLLDATAADRAQAVADVIARAEVASSIGAENMILVPIFGEPRIAPFGQSARTAAVETALLLVSLKEIGGATAKLPLHLVLEPLNMAETHLLVDPEIAACICRETGAPHIATMVDTYHCFQEGQDVPVKIAGTGDQLQLVHFSDSGRGLPGEGAVDFGAAVTALRTANYDGWVGWECRKIMTNDDVSALGASVTVIRQLLDTSVPM